MAPIPWNVIIPIAISLLSEMFEKEDDPLGDALTLKQQMDALGMKEPQEPFRNPYLPQMSEAAFKAVLQQMQRTENWGWPEGQGQDMSWLQDMLANVQPASSFGSGVTRKPITPRITPLG